MVDYKKCQFADILEDAKAHKRTSALKKYGLGMVEAQKADGSTYERKKTYLEIRKWYYEEYYPELLPEAKQKEPTIYDLLAEL
jgi:hypothetical protein